MPPSANLFESQLDRTRELVKVPDWYMRFGRFYKARLLGAGGVQAALFEGNLLQPRDRVRDNTVDIFEQLLSEDAVRLGRPGQELLVDQDDGRKDADTIVIHHSKRAAGISNGQLSALELLRLYAPEYAKGTVRNEDGSLQPIFSGHFDAEGRQVFYRYHWIVRQDGACERLLDDSAFAWHAGGTENVNSHSIAICIDDDLSDKLPTPESLESVAAIIAEHYTQIAKVPRAIVGHTEVNDQSVCPGPLFQTSWKATLLDRIADHLQSVA